MAENKKSFILYADLIHTVSKMPMDKAGELFLTILEYVNDQNPEPQDLLISIAFEPIKQQMKRDLAAWENEKEVRSERGRKGGIASAQSRSTKVNHKSTQVNGSSTQVNSSQLVEADNVNVTVTVNGNKSNTDITTDSGFINAQNLKFEFEKAQKDKRWKENYCMANKIDMAEMDEALTRFYAYLLSIDYNSTSSEIKKYFVNWVKSPASKPKRADDDEYLTIDQALEAIKIKYPKHENQ